MSVLAIAIAVGASAAAAVLTAREAKKKRDREWASAAASMGLNHRAHSFIQEGRIWGTLGAFQVSITIAQSHSSSPIVARLTVDSQGAIPSPLTLTRSGLMKGTNDSDAKIGDRRFQENVRIRGNALYAQSVLSYEARAKLGHLVAGYNATLQAGTLLAELPRSASRAQLISLMERMIVLASLLCVDTDAIAQRLLENLRSEHEPEAALMQLDMIRKWFAGSEADALAIDFALTHLDPRVALTAAARAGARGVPRARRVLESLDAPDDTRAAALAHLAEHGALPTHEVLTRFVRDDSPKLRARIALAFAELKAFEAQPLLLVFLDDADVAVRINAARALEAIGTIEAIPKLLESSKGLLVSTELKQAARAAVEAIRKRLGDVEAGRLSLSALDDQGGLSLTADRGALSKPED